MKLLWLKLVDGEGHIGCIHMPAMSGLIRVRAIALSTFEDDYGSLENRRTTLMKTVMVCLLMKNTCSPWSSSLMVSAIMVVSVHRQSNQPCLL